MSSRPAMRKHFSASKLALTSLYVHNLQVFPGQSHLKHWENAVSMCLELRDSQNGATHFRGQHFSSTTVLRQCLDDVCKYFLGKQRCKIRSGKLVKETLREFRCDCPGVDGHYAHAAGLWPAAPHQEVSRRQLFMQNTFSPLVLRQH